MAFVRLRPSRAAVNSAPEVVQVEPGTPLHDAVRLAGLPIASACGADGLCARCGLEVVAGANRLSPETGDEQRVKQRNRIASHLRLACRARVEGDVEVTASYW